MANDFVARPVRFYSEYKTIADGSTIERHWVVLARPGNAQMAQQHVMITEKVKKAPEWGAIEAHYLAWCKGNEAPVTGTPLGAWPGLTPEQVQVFRACGLQTIEDIAGMTEKVMQMVRLPDPRRYKTEAATFLELKDKRGAELRLQQQNEKIAALEAQLAEMADSMALASVPKRRGRPPKSDATDDVEIDEAA